MGDFEVEFDFNDIQIKELQRRYDELEKSYELFHTRNMQKRNVISWMILGFDLDINAHKLDFDKEDLDLFIRELDKVVLMYDKDKHFSLKKEPLQRFIDIKLEQCISNNDKWAFLDKCEIFIARKREVLKKKLSAQELENLELGILGD